MAEDYTIEIDISADELLAKLKVVAPSEEDAPAVSISDLTEALKKSGVTYGLKKDVLEKIATGKIFNKWAEVAIGDKHTEGKDGSTKFHFSTEGPKVKIKEDSSGKINIRDLNLIENVKSGDILCELIPPKPGKSGMTVQEKVIPSKEGEKAKLPPGKNATPSEDGTKLLADTDGMVVWDGSNVAVEPIFVTDKVDASVGNIRFNGSVVVNGEVGDGFEIHASEDVNIAVTLGMVTIEAGGDVNVAGGIFGHNIGKITADNNVKIKFIQDAKVQAKGHIIVEDYILNSEVIASGPVVVKGPSGWISGSTVASETLIYTNTAGTHNSLADTNLIIGHDPNALMELERLYEAIENKIKDFLKLKASLIKLRTIKARTELNFQQEKLYTKILSAIETIRLQITETDSSANKIINMAKQTLAGYVFIEGTAYEGTTIKITTNTKEIFSPKQNIQFSLSKEEIIEEKFSLHPDVKALLETEETEETEKIEETD